MVDCIIFGAQRDFLIPAYIEIAGQVPSILVRSPRDLTEELLKRVQPRVVILPDWSWVIDVALLRMSRFVGFHAADLPNYRGGSPLQHQIIDGIKDTKLTCFAMESEVDAGPILLQERLDLSGSISDVWRRIAGLIPSMVHKVLAGSYEARSQGAGGFARRRRTPQMSELQNLELPIDALYNWIRALDDPYPNAFYRCGGKRLTFSAARVTGDALHAAVVITDDEVCK